MISSFRHISRSTATSRIVPWRESASSSFRTFPIAATGGSGCSSPTRITNSTAISLGEACAALVAALSQAFLDRLAALAGRDPHPRLAAAIRS